MLHTETIVVDLDGTLVNSDMLVENLFLFLRLYPLRFYRLFFWLLRGKAYFKQRLADAILPDVEALPYNHNLLDWLRVQHDAGLRLVLATASDIRIAQAVATHLGIFDEVMGTDGTRNLSAGHKRQALVDRFGERNYAYVGNSHADLPVWRSAAGIHVVNPERGVLAKARLLGEIGLVIEDRPSYLRSILKSMRLHQWAKNILIFVPLLASHRVFEWPLLFDGVLAFIAFGLCASSVYLLNDLLDLQDDRAHQTKRERPLAAGALPIMHAVVLVPVLFLLSFVLALWQLPLFFVLVLAAYYILTLAYSLWLKRVVMLDVVTLAILYTLRVIAGAAAMALVATFWILAFCMFIFLSLAFVKRYTELHDARQKGRADDGNLIGKHRPGKKAVSCFDESLHHRMAIMGDDHICLACSRYREWIIAGVDNFYSGAAGFVELIYQRLEYVVSDIDCGQPKGVNTFIGMRSQMARQEKPKKEEDF